MFSPGKPAVAAAKSQGEQGRAPPTLNGVQNLPPAQAQSGDPLTPPIASATVKKSAGLLGMCATDCATDPQKKI